MSKVMYNRPNFDIRNVMSDGTHEMIEIYSINDIYHLLGSVRMSRKNFLKFSAFTTATILLAACSGSNSPTPTLGPTITPQVLEGMQQPCSLLRAHTDEVNTIAASPTENLLVSGGQDGYIKLWQFDDLSLINKWIDGVDTYSLSELQCLAFNPDGNLLASGDYDGNIRIWKVSDGSLVRDMGKLKSRAVGVAFSPDGELLASADWSLDTGVHIWRVSDGDLVKEIKDDHLSQINSLAFSPDGELLAIAVIYGSYLVPWKLNDISSMKKLGGEFNISGDGTKIVFSPDGTLVAALSDTIGIYRVSKGDYVQQFFPPDASKPYDVVFSPDGKFLAIADGGGSIYLFRTTDWNLVREIKGYTYTESSMVVPIHCVAFSRDSTLLASGDRNGIVQIFTMLNPETADNICAFDPAATSKDQSALTYQVTDTFGIGRTYSLPCGSNPPTGAICTCNCIPGLIDPRGGGGGSNCSCVPVCTCMAV